MDADDRDQQTLAESERTSVMDTPTGGGGTVGGEDGEGEGGRSLLHTQEWTGVWQQTVTFVDGR